MYSVCSLQDADFRELGDEHKLRQGESFLDSADLVLSDLPYILFVGHREFGTQLLVIYCPRRS